MHICVFCIFLAGGKNEKVVLDIEDCHLLHLDRKVHLGIGLASGKSID